MRSSSPSLFNFAWSLIWLALCCQWTAAVVFPPRPIPQAIQAATDLPVTARDGTEIPPYDTEYFFDQLIDHNDPSKGTFKMRYYFTWEWYQPGGPITLWMPGDVPADYYTAYVTNKTVVGRIAQALNGASIVLEHRFFGTSNPGPDLTSKSLALMTVDQAIEDAVYFAQNVKLPMPGGDQVGADKAPWLVFGGSYSGALVAWIMKAKPGIFWSGYASSAVVQSIDYFWAYYEPIRQYMPKNCSMDAQRVIEHLDQVFTNGTKEEQQRIKNTFGMGTLTHNDDFTGALRINIWDWQGIRFYPGSNRDFYDFCDALETGYGDAPDEGWGLEHALSQWGVFWREYYMQLYCYDGDAEACLGTYDATQDVFTNTTLGQDYRPWMWLVCNELGWFQPGSPAGWPTIATRLTAPTYDYRQCMQFFPDRFKTLTPPPVEKINNKFGGWNISLDRVFFANGQRDPWRFATLSSDFHFVKSTPRQPIFVSEGFHTSDLNNLNADNNPSVKAVQDLAIAYMGQWVQEWRLLHPDVPAISNFTTPDPNTLPVPPPFTPTTYPEDIINAPPVPAPSFPAAVTGAAGANRHLGSGRVGRIHNN